MSPYDDADIEWFKGLDVTSAIIAAEVGEQGVAHLQGRITFKRAYRLGALLKLNAKVHWEITRAEKDTNYFRKRESVLVYEKVPERIGQGARKDLDFVRQAVKEKRPIAEIADGCTSFQAVKCIRTMMEIYGTKREEGPVEVHWYWGETGTGKSRKAHTENPDAFEPLSFKWWDGYANESTVILDDFRGDWCKYHELLRLLDRYPIKKEVKGGWVWLQVTKWIVTSTYHPENVYKTDEDKAQLLRRITDICHFTNDHNAYVGV